MYLAWLLEVFFPSKGRCKKLKFIWVVLTVSHLLRSSAFFSQNMKIKIYVSFAWLVNNFVDILFKLCPLSQCQTLLLLLGTRSGLMCPDSQSNSWWQSSVGVTQVCKMWIILQNCITQKSLISHLLIIRCFLVQLWYTDHGSLALRQTGPISFRDISHFCLKWVELRVLDHKVYRVAPGNNI